MGKMKDLRKESIFFMYGMPDKEGNFPTAPIDNPLIPGDAKNDILNIINGKGEPIGDIQIGTDGFIEAMLFLNGQIIKLKRFPSDNEVQLSAFGKNIKMRAK